MEQNKRKRKIAQSASELAIFGAILMFVIGLIVRVGLTQGLATNIQLRAMRMALTESYKTAQGSYRLRRAPSGARNNASIFILLDQLSVDAAQDLGTRDRIPMTASGSGTYSHNLFWTADWGDDGDLPIYDVFINNQRFPFTTASYRSITFNVNLFTGIGTATIPNYPPHPAADIIVFPIAPCGAPPLENVCWDPNCTSLPFTSGCLLFYTKQQNVVTFSQRDSNLTPAGEGWCDEIDEACPGGPAEADLRFNLDHAGGPEVLAGATLGVAGGTLLRDLFAWQWRRVAGLTTGSDPGRHILNTQVEGINIDDGINRSFDVDGDDEEEYIFSLDHNQGWITGLKYLDYQEGDIDFSEDNIGLQRDIEMFSQARGPQVIDGSLYGGTYLLIREGKLLGANGQFIQDVTRQDHVDLITRRFQISNNTGRFCTFPPNPVSRIWNAGPFTVQGVRGLRNPVEVCAETPAGAGACGAAPSDCNLPGNIERTCLDVTCNMLYIRSRIEDLRGHSWLTRVFQ